MMGKKDLSKRLQMSMISLEELVPENHLLRKIDMLFDFSFIYDEVEELYSTIGKESIDPVVLFKICFIQYLFGIRSMRRTIEEINYNIAYRWFLGYNFDETIPHFSTFGKNYARRFAGTDIFEKIFKRVLNEINSFGLLSPDTIFIDGTHIKASANKNKYEKTIIEKSTLYYEEELVSEINEDRKSHGKKPLKKKEITEFVEVKESTTDPDAGLFWKNERERMMCYSLNTGVDINGYFLGKQLSAGNVHDSKNFQPLMEDIQTNFKNVIENAAADAAYIAPHISKYASDIGINLCIPYKRPMTKKEFFPKYEYVYDEFYDRYICPNNKTLEYSTTDRKGKAKYKSNPVTCKKCELIKKCTNSKDHIKVIERHVWQEYHDEVNHNRHTKKNKAIYKLRKETVERRFGDAKVKHGMRETQYRGLEKNSNYLMLLLACMNMKKMANYLLG